MGPIIYATNYHANFSLLNPEKELKTKVSEGYRIKYGDKKNLSNLEGLIAMTNTLSNEEFENQITKVLDVDQYLTWLAGVVCTQNFDGFIHNYALYQNSETGLFEITPWDYDGTWGRDLHGKPLEHDYIPITGYNTLTGRILHFAHFKKKYSDILSPILENQFTVETQLEVINPLFNTLKLFIDLDPFIKIGGEILDSEREFMIDFIKKRNEYLKQQLIKLK
jgi:spore coat protein H